MSAMQIENMISYKLRKLAQSGLAPQDIALKMQEILEQDRQIKLASSEDQQEFMLPLIGRRKTYLNVV